MTIFKHSAVFVDLLTDTLYAATGDQVRPFFGAATARTARWRSPRFLSRRFPMFGWAKVNGRLTAPVVLRIYADGVLLYTTPAITTRDPVRLPAARCAHWEIEVESAGELSSVLLAATAEELNDG